MKKFVLVVNREEYESNPRGCYHGTLKFGDVAYHKDLLAKNEVCFGGGEWSEDKESKTLRLFEESAIYGYPKFDFIDDISLPDIFKGYKVWYEFLNYRHKENKTIQ